jgi:hypothetical protein
MHETTRCGDDSEKYIDNLNDLENERRTYPDEHGDY